MPVARQQFTDGNGSPLSGGSVAFCTPGTSGTVYRPVYADEAETIPVTNPVPLDSAGITFSGGSQVTLWGFGAYEIFLKDASGNLIYSAILDTPGGLEGGTINGSVQINGNLSVTGNVSDSQVLNTQSLVVAGDSSFGQDLNVGGAGYFVGNVQTDGDIDSAGTIAGQTIWGGVYSGNTIQAIFIGGDTIVAYNTLTATALSSANIQVTSENTGTLAADLLAADIIWLQNTQLTNISCRGGQVTTDGTGQATVSFSPPFANSVSAMVGTVEGTGVGGPFYVTTSSLNTSGGSFMVTTDGYTGAAGIQVYWTAVGI
jgi:hypothetical protein